MSKIIPFVIGFALASQALAQSPPPSAESLYQKGLAAEKSGDPVAAENFYKNALKTNPNHANARYSIGQLRPDVVAELWYASESDVAAIEGGGYVRVAPWVFVRADSAKVDRGSVTASACMILREDPFLLGSPRRFVADINGLAAPYCR